MKKIIVSILVVCVGNILWAQNPTPAAPQSKPIAIVNATLHIGDGSTIENGYLTFDKGKITRVGTSEGRPDLAGHEIVEAKGQHIYPGFILPGTNTGLVDIEAVRATRDFQEIGEITPHVRAQVAYNTDSEILPTLRFNGILLVQTTPQGGLISGISSVMMTDGWNWEDATYQEGDGLFISWPQRTFSPRWWMGETERRPNPDYDSQTSEIIKAFTDAKAYRAQKSGGINLALESILPVLDGKRKIYVIANEAKSIVESISRLKNEGLTQIVLVGGRDALYVKDFLKQHGIPVILDELHRLPARNEEPYDYPYQLPFLLQREGIKVAIRHTDAVGRARNLPFYAGTAAGFGMEKEEAIKLITSNPAEILGISDRTGTLTVGKDATLILTEGDVLDMMESKLTSAYIKGMQTELSAKHQILFERYKEKYQDKK